MTASPVPYFGGKTTLAPSIVSLLPAHEHYVEPFGGSLAVLLAKSPARMETINDLDEELMLFWRVLRDQPEELITGCALTPHSRAEYAAAADRDGCSDVERARRVWVRLTQSRTGTLTKVGWRYYQDPAGSSSGMPAYLAGYVTRMPPAVRRLQRVTLECRPALDVIEAFGAHREVLLYVDPPYLASTRSSGMYPHEMGSEDQHRELAAALLACEASVVLSGYPSALYDDLYAGWDRVEMAASTGQGRTWAHRTEVLWSNRPLDDQPGLWGASS